MTDKLLVSFDDGVTTLTINRPKIRNAVDAETMTALREALEAAANDGQTRVVVITGAGGAFCSGADIQSAIQGGDGGGDAVYKVLTEVYAPALLAVRNFPYPVIAAVDGYAAGIGCDLALRCDLRLVSENGIFAELFIRVGLVPDGGGTYMLPRLVGLGRAMEMMFTGRNVIASEAAEFGLANKVFPAETFEAEVMTFAKNMAQQAPLALVRGKKAMLAALEEGISYQEAMQREANLQKEIFASEDGFEGFTAFMEKRKPQWKGR